MIARIVGNCSQAGLIGPTTCSLTLAKKPYLCHLCGKQYALKTSLNLHIKKKHVNTSMAPKKRTWSIPVQDDEATSQWTRTVRYVESSYCPKCKDDICRCIEKMSPKGPPECSSCNNSVCVCNTLPQNEYKEFKAKCLLNS